MSEHDELLARLKRYTQTSGAIVETFHTDGTPAGEWIKFTDAAAAIRDLTAKLETERRAQEEAERQAKYWMNMHTQRETEITKGKVRKGTWQGLYEGMDELCKQQQERAEQAESRDAAVFERTRELVRLCREVVSEHADEDSPFFNDCDTDEKRCQWCIDASAAILALAPEESVATQESACVPINGQVESPSVSNLLPAPAADPLPGLERAAEIVGDGRISGLRTITDNIYDAIRAEINRLKGG